MPNPHRIRERPKLTQEQIAARFEVPLNTLRAWAQGESFPDSATKPLLRVIDKDPDAVINGATQTYLPPVPTSPDRRS